VAAHWDRVEETSSAVSNAVSFSLSTSILFCNWKGFEEFRGGLRGA